MTHLAIILLAAGASERMGGADKLMEPVGDEPLLRRQARVACETGARVVVTLPRTGGELRKQALAGLPVMPVAAMPGGMGPSIATGLMALPGYVEAAMILPADMPELTTGDLSALFTVWETRRAAEAPPILRGAAADGTPGHPVLFPRRYFAELQALSADEGARGVLCAHAETVETVPLPAQHALTDLDTPEDWAAWRAKA